MPWPDRGLNICVHIIIGLPGESDEDVLMTAKTLATLPVNGIKIHSLLALDGTAHGRNVQKRIHPHDHKGKICFADG